MQKKNSIIEINKNKKLTEIEKTNKLILIKVENSSYEERLWFGGSIMKRMERTGTIIKILSENPGKLFSLNYFTNLFGAAKSTVSEDIAICKKIIESMDDGEIVTIAGAAGGVKYLPRVSERMIQEFQTYLCDRLNDSSRVLTGGFLYTSDVMFDPYVTKQAGKIFATKFMDLNADYVITIETKGIALALMTADALDVPLVVMRREGKISEGSTLSINYISGSSGKIQKMSVSKKSLVPGTKAIIIDDFMRGGGSAVGMAEMLSELDVETVGIGVLIATRKPEKKLVENYYPILYLDNHDDPEKTILVSSS